MFGGGRYDNLVGMFVNNTNISGVGFGFGDVTLENFLNIHKLIPDLAGKEARVLVTRFDDVPYEKYVTLAESLRAAGVTAMSYLGSKKFGKQIEYAVKAGCTYAVIMGASELTEGKVKVKDLNTREESTTDISKLVEFFRK
jgi:histidyl-tRNA synthetase